MLEIKKITKTYETNEFKQQALSSVSVNFRKNEFAAILGPSGSGKTTLLNIIGGLDHYDSGDLIINEVSTKKYTDRDWDAYRNHRVGFVFQSYNLITHQTVLQNVELALTLSGVSKTERRKKAKAVLKSVGLEKHMSKNPNQLSGGQMQRVAIARALINDPDILLADEPTGALDSETSTQIMELLKKVAKDKLVIMVTHNPELANQYASRIIKLKDGEIIDDTNPYDGKEKTKESSEIEKSKSKKTSMSLKTALSLSLNNLLTKKGRTILTAFAGSIGIIGIALILSLSHGLNSYIETVEADTLSLYPLTLEKTTMDQTTLMQALMQEEEKPTHAKDKVYSNNIMSDMLTSIAGSTRNNDLKAFKEYLENNADIENYVSDIRYTYNLNLNIYKADYESKIVQVNPSTVFENLGIGNDMTSSVAMTGMGEVNSWVELPSKKDVLDAQYELIAGRKPSNYDEVVLVTDQNNEISDYALYSLGLLDQEELKSVLTKIMNGEEIAKKDVLSYDYDDIIGLTYKLVLNTDYYQKNSRGVWVDKRNDEKYLKNILQNALDVKVVGILRIKEDSSAVTTGVIGYTKDLMEYTAAQINNSEIAKEQLSNKDINVKTGSPFSTEPFNIENLPIEQQQYLASLPQNEAIQYAASASATYESNLQEFGIIDLDDPYTIELYPKDFESKDKIVEIIDDFNSDRDEDDKLIYSDFVGAMMSSVTTIINAISYILIAFVSISLIVSSIMIAIITYISVIERTKEIGILRAIGARKKDVSRVFNAETLIEGTFAGVLGIIVTIILNIPINAVIYRITDISGLAKLPLVGAIILIAISILLTFIAGLIPAHIASKKDPVVALRTE